MQQSARLPPALRLALPAGKRQRDKLFDAVVFRIYSLEATWRLMWHSVALTENFNKLQWTKEILLEGNDFTRPRHNTQQVSFVLATQLLMLQVLPLLHILKHCFCRT